MQATTAVKRALERVFGPSIGSRKERKEIISKAVILASEDPGQWAPRAKVIVRTETASQVQLIMLRPSKCGPRWMSWSKPMVMIYGQRPSTEPSQRFTRQHDVGPRHQTKSRQHR